MTHIIQVGPNGSLILPKAIRSRFKPNDEVLVFVSKDTVVLKKLHHAKLSELSHRTKGRAMPMHGIVNEIRRYRQERKSLS